MISFALRYLPKHTAAPSEPLGTTFLGARGLECHHPAPTGLWHQAVEARGLHPCPAVGWYSAEEESLPTAGRPVRGLVPD